MSIKYCDDIGGVLASIHSPEQDQFLTRSLCGGEICWIGLHDRHGFGNWEWVDGSALDYENWYREYGVEHEFYQVVVYWNEGWRNTGARLVPAICMRSLPTMSPSTKPPTALPTMSPSTKSTEMLEMRSENSTEMLEMRSENSACVEKTEMFVFLSVISCLVILLLVLNACVLWRQGSIKLGGQNETVGVGGNSDL